MRLRIISGKFGGRFIESPGTETTHPMSERLRGSLFNMLGDLTDKTVLDAFAGSGALGLECISRGAKSALLLERDKRAQLAIQKNIDDLKVREQVNLIKANCRMWAQNNPDQQFDIILIDPPYHDMQTSTIELLAQHLNPKGLMVISYPGREPAPTVNGVVVVDDRNYGDAALAFYRQSN